MRLAPGIPHALCFMGEEFMHHSGASRREIAKVCQKANLVSSLRTQGPITAGSYSEGQPNKNIDTIRNIDDTAYGSLRSQGRRYFRIVFGCLKS